MTNNELSDIKQQVVKKITVRSVICVILYILLYAALIVGAILFSNEEDFTGIKIFFFIAFVFLSFVPLLYMMTKNYSDESKFSVLKFNEYKTRVLLDSDIIIKIDDINSDSVLKKNITSSVKEASIINGNVKIYNSMSFNNEGAIIQRYEVSLNTGNGNNQGRKFRGFIYVFKTPKLRSVNLKVSNFRTYSANFKKLTATNPYVLYNKKFYENKEAVSENAQNKILKVYDYFRNNEASNIDKRSLYGVTLNKDLTYLYISTSKANGFTKITDFSLDYNKFTKEIEDIYNVKNYIDDYTN